MAKAKKRRPPALTPEARENQLIAEATDLAEEQILAGTASPSVIVHFLKLATVKAQLENEKLQEENRLLKAKTENIQSQAKIDELYQNAIDAMRDYSGYSN